MRTRKCTLHRYPQRKKFTVVSGYSPHLWYSNWTVPTGTFKFQLTLSWAHVMGSMSRKGWEVSLADCGSPIFLSHWKEPFWTTCFFSLRTKSKFPTRRKINGRCSTYKFYKSGSFTSLYKLSEAWPLESRHSRFNCKLYHLMNDLGVVLNFCLIKLKGQ